MLEGDNKCGFCKLFPGDGHQCFTTLDIVSYSVRSCDKFEERDETQNTTEPQNVNVDPLVTHYAKVFINDQDYTITFHHEGKIIGKMDLNGPTLLFEGDAEESAKVFIEWLGIIFRERLVEERERCAKLCDDADKSTHPADLADAIRGLA